jgi:hypothetical protein
MQRRAARRKTEDSETEEPVFLQRSSTTKGPNPGTARQVSASASAVSFDRIRTAFAQQEAPRSTSMHGDAFGGTERQDPGSHMPAGPADEDESEEDEAIQELESRLIKQGSRLGGRPSFYGESAEDGIVPEDCVGEVQSFHGKLHPCVQRPVVLNFLLYLS